MNQPSVSIVIPLHDEEENLQVLAREIDLAMSATAREYEVLFVDDASRDSSLEVLRGIAQRETRVRILALPEQGGQSAALAHGFAAARGSVVVTLDADLQNDPADIPRLLAALEDLDMVIGVRALRHDSWVRRLSSRVANGVRSRLLADGASDTGCALKAIRVEVLRQIPTFNGLHRFLPALVRMQGGRVQQIPVNHRPRLHGSPKYNIRNRLGRGIVDMLGVLWLQRRWIHRQAVAKIEVSAHAGEPPRVSSVKDFSKASPRRSLRSD